MRTTRPARTSPLLFGALGVLGALLFGLLAFLVIASGSEGERGAEAPEAASPSEATLPPQAGPLHGQLREQLRDQLRDQLRRRAEAPLEVSPSETGSHEAPADVRARRSLIRRNLANLDEAARRAEEAGNAQQAALYRRRIEALHARQQRELGGV